MMSRYLACVTAVLTLLIGYAVGARSVAAQSLGLPLQIGTEVTLHYAIDESIRCTVTGFSGDNFVRCSGTGPKTERWFNLATVRSVWRPTPTP